MVAPLRYQARTVPHVRPKRLMPFGVLSTDNVLAIDSTHDVDEFAHNLRLKTVFLPWRTMEATKGTYTGFAAAQTRINALLSAGIDVILAPATHNPPSWLYTDAETSAFAHWKNQRGVTKSTVTGGVLSEDDESPNLIFSQVIRDKTALFVAACAANLVGPFVFIRPPGLAYGEWSYPHPTATGGDFWAYDAAAQGGAGRPTTVPVCPVPGWTPGTGTVAQATSFLNWYLAAIADAQRWSVSLIGQYFPGAIQVIMLPSFGIRAGSGDIASCEAGLLASGTQLSEVRAGVDFAGQLSGLGTTPPTNAPLSTLIPYCTWSDCQYGTWAGGGSSQANPYDFIATTAAANGFPGVGGEGTGDQTRPALMREFERHNRLRPRIALYAFERNLYDGPPDVPEVQDLALLYNPNRTARDAITLDRSQEARSAYRQAQRWNTKVLVGEHGIDKVVVGWRALQTELLKDYDAYGFDTMIWAAWPATGYNLAAYEQVSTAWTVGAKTAISATYEALPGAAGRLRGVNTPGGDFGNFSYATPGVLNTDYGYPTAATFTWLVANTPWRRVRLPFMCERILTAQDGLTLRTAEWAALKACIQNADAAGMTVILDMHNYGRVNTAAPTWANNGNVLLGSGWTTVQHEQAWATILTAVKADAACNRAVIAISHNEPHDFPATAGTFTANYTDAFTTSVQGWTANGGTAPSAAWQNVSPFYVRYAGTTAGAFDELALERGNIVAGSGAAFQALCRLNATLSGSPAFVLGWQDASYAWHDSPGVAAVLNTWVTVTYDFASMPGARNYRVELKGSNGVASQTVSWDLDYWSQGASSGSLNSNQVHETLFASWVTAVRALPWTGWIWVPTANYCSLANFGTNHPGATRFWTDASGQSGIELHHYYDLDHSGTYTNLYNTDLKAVAGYS